MKITKTITTLSFAFAMFGGPLVLVPSEAEAAKIGQPAKGGNNRAMVISNGKNDGSQAKAKSNKKGRDAAKNLI